MTHRTTLTILLCAACGLLALPSRSGSMVVQDPPEPRVIEVTVKRYEFVPSSIEAVQGEKVRIVVTSGDGLHGFGIKKFNVSKEIARGATVTIEFTADAAGEFPILCTEFCGDGHETMRGLLVVKARDAGQP